MTDSIVSGEGYALAHIDALGDEYGFRKIRKGLGVTAFGMNAICMPPGIVTGRHFHEEQEEVYFVHKGTIEMTFGDGDAIYVIVGGKDGYVGRDGRAPEGETGHVRTDG